MHRTTALTLLAITTTTVIASPWPAGPEIPIDIDDASNNLSGATWNPITETLWVVRQDGQLWEFAYAHGSESFELVRLRSLPAAAGTDIEACMQVEQFSAHEIYTLDENTGIVSKIVNLDGIASVQRSWNLSTPNNGHTMPGESGGAGPEAIEFVPDTALLEAGFKMPDGTAYAGSTKGMGGLIFVGHQSGGLLHVFDVNPGASNDFVNYGSFQTSATEVAGLHFDRASGLMYIWHNPGNVNSLEVTTMSSDASTGTIDAAELYDTDMPQGNLEGIALAGQSACGAYGAESNGQMLFLTRDGGSPNLGSFRAYPCSTDGACCVVTGCDTVSATSCGHFGGLWLGTGTSCNECPPSCRSDLDGNDDVDINDLLTLLADWGPCP
ncbi:MAG: hypothetical protein QF561_04055 [Phycisphaerales bacterium]|jgi:hypothetical protein|nr:hypothetical protein [Phycisphaerales bacterium]